MEGDPGPANAASFQSTKSRHDVSPQIMSLPISISSGRIVLGLIFELMVFLSWTATSLLILVWIYFRIEQSFQYRSTPTWIAALPALVFVASGCLFPPFRKSIIPLIIPVEGRQKRLVTAAKKRRGICCWTCCCGRSSFADFAYGNAIMTEVNALAQVYGNVSILVPADWRFTPGRRIKVEDVSNIRFDSELFIRFRELYFRNRSWIQRFLEMKEVKEIVVINFKLLPLDIADALQKNDWPSSTNPDWIYTSSHPTQTPRLDQQILIHLRRNPHHSDCAAYQKWKKNASPVTQLLERLRLHSVLKTLRLPLDNYKLYQFPQFPQFPQAPSGKAQPE
ncbi:hypothetical protein L207DRAFT_562775 [Hyaloscypha variabilis F]|uniref:Uncharacterized protein n=1 Tax=Hyaloscypha variabilis (strain UAMH 11265 / GT02V1 / F) TaxID=1149755 RepID=A0A2J6S4H2_HYAVF|nr:hypothetical protein L207DRAFT_562775 [Hyaloscypha variabilis F]